ncbi:MAG: M15 family metallopeptidase, partial [Oscillospiraceae bacterium]
KKDGVSLQIISGYRTKERSETLFKNKVNSYLKDGYIEAAAQVEASKWVAPPGSSEHHTGLALDIVTPKYTTLNAGFANTDAAQWLYDNSYKYGFILRYPKGKEEITEINFEPWHYRYVGKGHAYEIKVNKLTLEEYLD